MYVYENIKSELFTDDGQEVLMRVRDFAIEALKQRPVIQMQEMLKIARSSSDWLVLACADRLVETGLLREISASDCIGQHRTFMRA